MAAVLVDHGRIAALCTTGRLDDTRPAPIDRHTVFELGSITKLFTALLIFRLQQRHLDVTAPIGQYVEGLPSAWASTSLLQLLSHTPGIPNYLNEENFLRLMPTNPAPVNCSQRWPSGRWRLRPVRGTPIPIRTTSCSAWP